LRLKINVAYQAVAVQLECEDENKVYVKVSVYNFSLKGKSFKAYFYPGRSFFIKEPFYKIAGDGKTNVRIDDPSDV
jgi:hypothetical protein